MKPVTIMKGELHIDHAYGWENRRILRAADEMGMTQQQLNNFVNSKFMCDKFRIETKADNLSHKHEKPGNGELGEIKKEMKRFLEGNK